MLDLSQLQSTPAAGTASAMDFIFDATTANFENDVLKASLEKPIIVEFWAPWCGPCKQLMPLLEKEVIAAGGAVLMAKVNIDQNPDLAQALRVQSVPMVYAFFQGQPVDGFMGVKPASEIAAFVGKILALTGGAAEGVPEKTIDKAAVEKLLQDGREKFNDDNVEMAMADFSNALDLDPDHMGAMAGLCWCFIAQKDVMTVHEIISQLTDVQQESAEISGVKKIISFASAVEEISDIETLIEKIKKSDKDHQARYDLALQYLALCDIEAAIVTLVDLIKINREWQEQRARQLLLTIFEALGNGHPLAAQGRRQLSAVLFS